MTSIFQLNKIYVNNQVYIYATKVLSKYYYLYHKKSFATYVLDLSTSL
jgi:hypothetical protein